MVSLTESEGRDFADARRSGSPPTAGCASASATPSATSPTCCPRARDGIRLLGTSGTVTTLASVHLALPSYDRRAVDGLHVPVDGDARDQRDAVRHGPCRARASFPCIGHERADLVVAGCAILEAIMDIWPAETLGVADRGIREGILRSLMARDGMA